MDTLARTKKLEALGFERPMAEGLVQMVKQSIDEEVAKKTDLERTENLLSGDIKRLENEIKRVETSLGSEIKRVETSLGSEIKRVETTLKADIERVETKLSGDIEKLDMKLSSALIGVESKMTSRVDKLESRIDKQGLKLFIWLGSLMTSLIGILLASIVFVEPLREKLGVKDMVPASKVIQSHAAP